MKHDYSKRDYLLPNGCKDLMDVLKLQSKLVSRMPDAVHAGESLPALGELLIPAHTTVLQLAGLLKKKPMRIVLDLMELHIFARITDELDFETIAAVVRSHGYIAKNAA